MCDRETLTNTTLRRGRSLYFTASKHQGCFLSLPNTKIYVDTEQSETYRKILQYHKEQNPTTVSIIVEQLASIKQHK